MVFVSGKPVFLIELKTTRGNPSRLYRDEVVQAKTYGLLLNLMGFDCSKLRIVVPKVRRTELAEKEKFMDQIIFGLLKQNLEKVEEVHGGDLKIHIFDYDKADVEGDLLWARDYWIGEREPIPTTKAAKCKTCEFKSICTSASRTIV